jgi:hypothetical protein
MSETKYYRVTKVKRHAEGQSSYVPVGKTLTGYLSEEDLPEVDKVFTFSSERLTGGWIQTSLVEEVEKEVEPGVTFIRTMNSIYKLEELQDA